MILTEEQKRALKRVVAYMDEMYAIASLYHGCTEDANILRAMIDSGEHFTDASKMPGFDLERARGLRDFLQDDCAEVGDVWAEMIAEIERLRPFEIAARDLDSDLTKIAGERDDQAARIKELEADNQNLVTMNKALMKNDWILRDNNGKYRKRSQKAELLNKSLKSKIGPDARPPCWQITEERIGLLRYCLDSLLDAPDIEESPGPRHSIEMLRTMLAEAEQCE